MDRIKIKAPATVANLSCGFDVLGLCLNQPYDEIEVIKTQKKEVIIDIIDSPYSDIPDNPIKNTGGVPALNISEDLNLDFGFKIKIKKGIPLCGGLGSSAATAAGVVFAINKLLNNQLNRSQMLQYAFDGEQVSTPSAHADNIAPCLLGGLTLIRDTNSLDVIEIPISDFNVVLIHPHIKIYTEDSRQLLPEEIKLTSGITQWGNVGALVFGFSSKNNDIIKRSMNDVVVEPIRSGLIKGFNPIKKYALEAGALGCSISGSGPTIFALCDSEEISKKIQHYSDDYYKSLSMGCDTYISNINHNGPVVL